MKSNNNFKIMLSEETKAKIDLEAWKVWEEDQKTNPTKVNPHAFVYGYKIAASRSEKLLDALKAIRVSKVEVGMAMEWIYSVKGIAKQAIENHNK